MIDITPAILHENMAKLLYVRSLKTGQLQTILVTVSNI